MAGSSHLGHRLKAQKSLQFRISQPNKKDDYIEDVQRARPMLFSKYRAQRRASAGSSDFSSLCESGVQTGQNVLDDSLDLEDELKGKRKQTTCIAIQKKWTWKYIMSLSKALLTTLRSARQYVISMRRTQKC